MHKGGGGYPIVLVSCNINPFSKQNDLLDTGLLYLFSASSHSKVLTLDDSRFPIPAFLRETFLVGMLTKMEDAHKINNCVLFTRKITTPQTFV